MKGFGELKQTTQKEIAELINSDKYKPEKDLSKFNNLKDNTQKEIAELKLNYDSESAENQIKEFVFENKFNSFRIFKITEFEAEQQKKQKQRMDELQKKEQIKQEREFADSEQVKHALGIKAAEGDIVSVALKETSHAEFRNEKNLISAIKENEQKYMKFQAEKEIKLLKSISNLGYAVKLYE